MKYEFKKRKMEKSSFPYPRGTTPKCAKSGGVYLRGTAPGQRNSGEMLQCRQRLATAETFLRNCVVQELCSGDGPRY